MKCHDRMGVTLIELSLVSVMMVALGTVLLQFYQASLEGVGAVKGQGIVRMQLAQAMTALSQDVAEARTASAGSSCGLAATPSGLLLRVPSIDQNDEVIAGIFDQVCYDYRPAPDEALWRRVAPHSQSSRQPDNRPVARFLTAVSFTALAGNRIGVNLTAGRLERGRTYLQPLTVQLALRNWSH